MIREKWNDGWSVSKEGQNPMIAALMGVKGAGDEVMLPHDAMIHEKRTPDTQNRHNTGFYPGGIYTYTKVFDAPKEWEDKSILVEFEGVYRNARVYINGDYAGGYPYGYTNFYVRADDFLKFGQPNEIKVIANNKAEDNSRWYTGSGIYRNVNLLIGKEVHVREDGLRISTPEVDKEAAIVQAELRLENKGNGRHRLRILTQLWDGEGKLAASGELPITLFGGQRTACRQRLMVENPMLWDCEHPALYECTVKLMEETEVWDECRESFGIRTLSLDAKRGLRINGESVKLRGSCIHHDNGILGACTLERAEERRCRQLKEAGFNCIRSAHNPLSRAMLEACDREGMLVLDELSDCWTRSKNVNDYAQNFPDYWERDAEQMVAKDFNHPCVIMYLTGNEIQEAGTAKGAAMNRLITERLHELDPGRYVTSAVNALLACGERMGEIMASLLGMSPEDMMKMAAAKATQGSGGAAAGVDAANGSAMFLKGPMADAFATSGIVSEMLEEFVAVSDLAGYNYLTARHEMERSMYPGRALLGTETLPSDIVRLWKIAKENPHVIGDMTWTGYDYLGEAGAGVFYYDGRKGFMPNWPVSVAYMGDIDIIGYRRPMSYFREIVYGLRHVPYLAVGRMEHCGETANKTAWMWKDEIASWTWHGHEGKTAHVSVYSDAPEVELFLNGVSLGRKPAGEENGFCAEYEVTYVEGTLEAVNLRNGQAAETCVLMTASSQVELNVEADRVKLKADGADLSFLTVNLIDKNGNQNLQETKEVRVWVEGAGTLQGFGSADPETENSYHNTVWKTYDGYLLAVIRAGTKPGEVKAIFSAEGCKDKEVMITVE